MEKSCHVASTCELCLLYGKTCDGKQTDIDLDQIQLPEKQTDEDVLKELRFERECKSF